MVFRRLEELLEVFPHLVVELDLFVEGDLHEKVVSDEVRFFKGKTRRVQALEDLVRVFPVNRDDNKRQPCSDGDEESALLADELASWKENSIAEPVVVRRSPHQLECGRFRKRRDLGAYTLGVQRMHQRHEVTISGDEHDGIDFIGEGDRVERS